MTDAQVGFLALQSKHIYGGEKEANPSDPHQDLHPKNTSIEANNSKKQERRQLDGPVHHLVLRLGLELSEDSVLVGKDL